MSSSKCIAILDDYLQLASKHLVALNKMQPTPSITVFTDKVPLRTALRPSEDEMDALVKKLEPFEIISTMRERTPFPADLLRRLPNLKLLLATGTQHSTFDIGVAKELGITVATAPGKGKTQRDITKGNVHPTTQHAWSLILGLARNIAEDDYNVKHKLGWQTSLATGLTGKTLGICGLGRLGASTARIGILAWGMKVICWSTNLTQQKADEMAKDQGLPVEDSQGIKTFQVVNKEGLFKQADVLSVHYVLSPRSVGLIGKVELSAMKPDAFLINTARGPLIDEDALYDTLVQGKIAGAALDVFAVEPLPEQDRWRSTKWGQDGKSRLLLTPHMGYVEEEIMNTWYEETSDNIERWINGKQLLNRLN